MDEFMVLLTQRTGDGQTVVWAIDVASADGPSLGMVADAAEADPSFCATYQVPIGFIDTLTELTSDDCWPTMAGVFFDLLVPEDAPADFLTDQGLAAFANQRSEEPANV